MQIVHSGERARLSVLTPQLVRFEWSPTGRFVDAPTQVVLQRDLGEVAARVTRSGGRGEDGGGVEIVTDGFVLTHDGGEPTPSGLSLQVRGAVTTYHSVWRFGEPPRTHRRLDGTARTLDDVDGRCELEPGIVSRDGWAVLDDSRSLVRTGPGTTDLEPREPGSVDLYVFAHGLDYAGALRDFYGLTGPVPRVPRYVLGNWWSRYHPYTAGEYSALLDRFAADDLPFSVAVLDMDWHQTDVDPRLGSGWTGYTFDRDRFPDPPAFLRELHERGLRVTLNDHPADGVRAHEEAYPQMARALGVDPDSELPLPFDLTDEEWTAAFFEHVAHPLERQGVDFWWIDWQSGPWSRMPGLDPLWALNERHFAELASTGRRPLIFSRYAGPGSHRTPVGFSGDTIISWASLAFQPEFTASAANIGYGWWSHDIGGHRSGVKDVELAVRWGQLGVWSPVNRLHATASPFQGKEPWRFGPEAERLMGDALRLRHRLVPYLATMAERACVEGVPLCRPVYHAWPERDEAYAHRSTYLFGSELLCAPVVVPRDRRAGVARSDVWLPPGTWFDWETGWRYAAGPAGRTVSTWRDLASTAVFAPAGAIVPLDDGPVGNGVDLPDQLLVRVFAGADGEFVLVEDDDEPVELRRVARTPIRLDWAARRLTIGPAEGDLSILPGRRSWRVEVVGLTGAPVAVRQSVPVDAAVELHLDGEDAVNPVVDAVFAFLDAAEIEHDTKSRVWGLVTAAGAGGGLVAAGAAGSLVAELGTLDLDAAVLGRLLELITAS